MDDTERHPHAPAARTTVAADLPYKSEWVGEIRHTFDHTLLDDQSLKDMTLLRKMFEDELKALTNGQGLFINILMQGRKRLLLAYRTIFERYLGHHGHTDPPTSDHPRVRFNSNLVDPVIGSLAATMIHEYTHLATIAVYDNTEPWHAGDKDEEKRVVDKLALAYPINDNGKYIRWEKWLGSLSDPKLQDQIRGVLKEWAGYNNLDWNLEALPHIVEIIYYLYQAGISWWDITEGPISAVAELLVKFTLT